MLNIHFVGIVDVVVIDKLKNFCIIMNSIGYFLLFSTLISTSFTVNVSSSTNFYLTFDDKIRLKKVLEPNFKLQQLSEVYYAVSGFKYINNTISRVAEICEFLIKSTNESLTAEQIYYLSCTWKLIERCQLKSFPLTSITKTLITILEKDSSVSELYYAISSLSSFNHKLPDATTTKLVKRLQAILKIDDSPLTLGYIFHIAANLGLAGNFAFNYIEDAIVQADEVDGRFLQFEGGLSVTSLLINGVFKLSSILKKKPPLTPHQTVKLANYFLSRRSVQTAKGAVNFLSSLNILATNDFENPICITLFNESIAISVEQPLLYVRICDLLGNPLSSVKNAIANRATKVGDSVVIINKKHLESTPNDKTLFILNFMDTISEPGFYKILISAASVENTVIIKALTKVKVDYLEIGTADADQTTQPKLVNVAEYEKLTEKIQADFQQKLVVRFLLKDNLKHKPMKVHQAFVRLSPLLKKKKKEIIFVAEVDASHVYKFDMPVGIAARDFNYESGDYSIELIIGDAVLSNSFHWNLATVELKFPESMGLEGLERSTYKQEFNMYLPKPEIKHMYRQPEKRPSVFLSNMFTVLCLSPISLLLILWIKLGVNISNFPFSSSAIIFHFGLGSIFILFGIFWLRLNMFTTLQYLVGLGIITFLSGNKLLSEIAYHRKASH